LSARVPASRSRWRAIQQCLLELRQLLVGQLWQPTGSAAAPAGPLLALGEQDPVPARRGLRRNTQFVHHVDLTLAAGEHVRRGHPPVLQSLKVPSRRHPSARSRPSPAGRSRYTPIVLYRNTNQAQLLTVFPKTL